MNTINRKIMKCNVYFFIRMSFVYLLICLTINGCKKDDVDDTVTISLLTDIISGDDATVHFTYDDQLRLIKIEEFDEEMLEFSMQLSYGETGELIKRVDNYIDFIIESTFHREGNIITWSEESGVTRTFELNIQGLVEKCTHTGTWDNDGWWESVENFQYNNQNIKSISSTYTTSNGHDPGTQIVTYTHDNKKSPFYHCNTPLWVKSDFINRQYGMSIQNNVKTISYSFIPVDISYAYEYNTDGLPVSSTKTSIYDDGRTDVKISTLKYATVKAKGTVRK